MSKIEWTNETWNPVTGCTKISEGCQHCYAERMARRLYAMGQEKYKNCFQVTMHEDCLNDPLTWKKPQIIFVCSMSDLFHKDVPDEFIIKVFEVMNKAHWHTFQVLTKRAERLEQIASKLNWTKNIWLGVTVEKENYKNRIEFLRHTDAQIKFLSCEPLLGDLGELDLTGIDWVIAGGESGPGARPMHPDWVRNILKQCQEQNVPFFFKQWGEYRPIINSIEYENTNEVVWITKDNRIAVCKTNRVPMTMAAAMIRVGKSKSGAILDGKEYKEFPITLQKEGK